MRAPVRRKDPLRTLLWESETLYAAELGADGVIAAANQALERAAHRPLAGTPFGDLLAAAQRPAFDAALGASTADWQTVTVGILDAGGNSAEDRRLHLRLDGDDLLAVAEPAGRERDRLVEQVLALNDELIASQRTLGRRQRELEQARAEAERALRRAHALETITLAGLSSAGLDEVLHTLLGVARDVLGSDRATVLLVGEGERFLVARDAVGLAPEIVRRVRVPVGAGVAGTIAATRRSRIVDDLKAVDVVSAYLREPGGSLAGVPLLLEDRLLGVLHVSSLRPHAFTEETLQLLEIIGERAALAIGQAQVRERERRIAETLQRSLLPSRLAEIDGVELAARYVPRAHDVHVGGDFYDAFRLPGGRVGLLIGDVAGKGLPAASAMGHVRSAVRACALDDPAPGELLARLDRLLDFADPMATAIYLTLDPASGEVLYANAGHPPVVHVSGGAAAFLDEALSPPLGTGLGRDTRETARAHVEPGSRLLLYTDGLIERRTVGLLDNLELLGRRAAKAPADPDALCQEVLDAFGEEDGFEDDVALLAAALTG